MRKRSNFLEGGIVKRKKNEAVREEERILRIKQEAKEIKSIGAIVDLK